VSSADQLTVRYQNFMLARTMRPLEDEDFKNVSRIIFGLKTLGIVLLMGSLFMGVSIIS